MPVAGEVYFGIYKFIDGGCSPKLIVLLFVDTVNDIAISCIVTKHKLSKDKATNTGCRPASKRFFIPASKNGFDIDSYLELTRNKLHSVSNLTPANGIELKFCLPLQVLQDIKNCIKKLVHDIPPDLFKLITS